MEHEQSNINQNRTLNYVRILHNIPVIMLKKFLRVVPINRILSIGPSLYSTYYNTCKSLFHFNSVQEKVQVQIGLQD